MPLAVSWVSATVGMTKVTSKSKVKEEEAELPARSVSRTVTV